MRILASLADDRILQVEKKPDLGRPVAINGKYSIDIPECSSVRVDEDSYVLNAGVVDSGSVVDQAIRNLTSLFPGTPNIVYNPLITASDSDFDLSATFSDGTNSFLPRAQIGRPSGINAGLAPNSVAVLPANTKTTPERPGILITNTLDISTESTGSRNFRVWWKLYGFETSEDVGSSAENTAAIRSIIEEPPEPSGFEVWISSNNGASWVRAGYLDIVDTCVEGTDIRIAFVNRSTTKRYIAAFAVLFP